MDLWLASLPSAEHWVGVHLHACTGSRTDLNGHAHMCTQAHIQGHGNETQLHSSSLIQSTALNFKSTHSGPSTYPTPELGARFQHTSFPGPVPRSPRARLSSVLFLLPGILLPHLPMNHPASTCRSQRGIAVLSLDSSWVISSPTSLYSCMICHSMSVSLCDYCCG